MWSRKNMSFAVRHLDSSPGSATCQSCGIRITCPLSPNSSSWKWSDSPYLQRWGWGLNALTHKGPFLDSLNACDPKCTSQWLFVEAWWTCSCPLVSWDGSKTVSSTGPFPVRGPLREVAERDEEGSFPRNSSASFCDMWLQLWQSGQLAAGLGGRHSRLWAVVDVRARVGWTARFQGGTLEEAWPYHHLVPSDN